MHETVTPEALSPPTRQARWDDLDAFTCIYTGVKQGKTIQEVGISQNHPHGNARLLYLRLARLEEALCTQLIYRKKWSRKTRVTPAGERLVASLAELHRFRERLARGFQSRRPRLTVATTMTVNSLIFPLFLAWVRTHRGDLGLNLRFCEGRNWKAATQMVREGQADVGLVGRPVGQPAAPDLREELFTPENAILLCPSDHPLAERGRSQRPVDLRDLVGEGLALHHRWFDILPDEWKKAVRLQVPHYLQTRQFVRHGSVVAPGWRTIEEMDSLPGVITLPLNSPIREQWVLLFSHHFPNELTSPVRVFLDDLRTFLRRKAAPRPVSPE